MGEVGRYRGWRSKVTDRPFPEDQCEHCGQRLGEKEHACKPMKERPSNPLNRMAQVATLTRRLATALMAEDDGRLFNFLTEIAAWEESRREARQNPARKPAKTRALRSEHCAVCGDPVYIGGEGWGFTVWGPLAVHGPGSGCWETYQTLREALTGYLAWEHEEGEPHGEGGGEGPQGADRD